MATNITTPKPLILTVPRPAKTSFVTPLAGITTVARPARTSTVTPLAGSSTVARPTRTATLQPVLDILKVISYDITPQTDAVKYQIIIYDTNGNIVALPQDVLSGTFTDIVNGGSAEGHIVVPKRFVDLGWINYNYRVQFYLMDGIGDPWYDGRVVDFDQETIAGSGDREQITIHLEGWHTALNNSIVYAVINSGVQPNGHDNGIQYADDFLTKILSQFVDSSLFGPSNIPTIQTGMDKVTFDSTELGKVIDDTLKQILDQTGNTYEWWVRGTRNGKPAIVIQANANPAKQTFNRNSPTQLLNTNYMVEFMNDSIYDYKIQNSSRGLYNMIALYGGKDPTTGQQIYGAYKDTTSIALYGLRQKKVTNTTLLSAQALSNYGTVYLLLNGYPQPQGSFKKFAATDFSRAGQWWQVFEKGLNEPNALYQQDLAPGTLTSSHSQNAKQFRCVKVVTSFHGGNAERVEQEVFVAAPRPFIDHAFYGAIQTSQTTVAVQQHREQGTQVLNYYLRNGMDYLSATAGLPPTVTFNPPSGYFNSSTLTVLAGGNVTLPLTDSLTGASGDGNYEVMFVQNELTTFGAGVNGPALHVTKTDTNWTNGVAHLALPSDPTILRGRQFLVINGQIKGDKELRTFGGIGPSNIVDNSIPVSKITGGVGSSTLAGDTDVYIPAPTAGQVLQYNAVTTLWNAVSRTLVADTDVNIASPLNGQALTYDTASAKWKNLTPVTTLAGDGDVSILTPTNHQLLVYNSGTGKWENKPGRTVIAKLSAADFTPSVTGTDLGSTWVVPYDPGNANTSVTWTITKVYMRTEVVGTTATSLKIQHYTGTGLFANTAYVGGTYTVAGSTYESVTLVAGGTTVNSNDKLLIEYTALGTGATGFTVALELVES